MKTNKQFIIAIGGASANGKSTLANNLKLVFNVESKKTIVLDSDATRKKIWYAEQGVENYDLKTVLPSEAYGSDWGAKTYQALMQECEIAIKNGNNVIVDATFLAPEQRQAFEKMAADADITFKGLWLENDQDALKKRADKREKGVSDANGFVVGLQFKKDFGDLQGWQKIRTDKTAMDTLKAAIKGLKR